MTSLGGAAIACLFLPVHAEAPLANPDETPVRLHIVLQMNIDPRELALARRTAAALLNAARVATEWEDCGATDLRCAGGGGLTVRLLATRASGEVSGHLVRDDRHGSTALVHVPAHAAVVRRVHQSPAGRSLPLLSGLRLGHVLGLTIAHEVGHALGLRHADAGVMKGRAGLADLVALRQSSLAFRPEEVVQMRRAAESGAARLARHVR